MWTFVEQQGRLGRDLSNVPQYSVILPSRRATT
jgi:hypothetical protein